jgi:hypothetical protein
MKSDSTKNLHPSLLFLAISIGFPLIMITLSAIFSLVNNKSPNPLPSPPEKIDKLLGISTGGFEVTDPVIRSVDDKEFIYLDSFIEKEWQPLNEYRLYDDISSLEKQKCGWVAKNIIKMKAGPIVDCIQATSVGEWTPPPTGYYALSSSGILWRYKSTYSFPLNLFLYLILGIVLGLLTTIINLTKNKRDNLENHGPA